MLPENKCCDSSSFNHSIYLEIGMHFHRRHRNSASRHCSSNNPHRCFHLLRLEPLMDLRLVNINPNNQLSAIIIGLHRQRPSLITNRNVTRTDRNRGTSGLNNCWFVSFSYLLTSYLLLGGFEIFVEASILFVEISSAL